MLERNSEAILFIKCCLSLATIGCREVIFSWTFVVIAAEKYGENVY